MRAIIEVQSYIRYRNGEREVVCAHDRGNASYGTRKSNYISFTGEEGRTKAQEALAHLRAKGYAV